MEVAKSYEGLPRLSEPFERDGKMYITVELKSGKAKDVRWYGTAKYNQKKALGFVDGYITIFKGVKPEHEEWFCESICRFATTWGWYIPSFDIVPEDLPDGVKPVRLDWAPMAKSDTALNMELVSVHVQNTLNPTPISSKSIAQGEVGTRLERNLVVLDKETVETKYGKTHTYIFTDENENIYLWKTAAKDWEVGYETRLRGTVKEFIKYKGVETTTLTRCMESK